MPPSPQSSPAPRETAGPLLEVADLSKDFIIHHIGRRVPALRGISFTVAPGQFVRLHGPNGAGKSTVLRCLYRTYKPSGGVMRYQSLAGPTDLATASDIDVVWLRRREISFVTQFLNPRPRVSALELVAEPLREAGQTRREASETAAALLLRLGLRNELWGAYPATFSGGEQQKVNLARGLAAPRRLLLIDEPTASLDHEARIAVARELAKLKAVGTAMIGVVHHAEDLGSLIDETLHLQPVVDSTTPTPDPSPVCG